MMDPQKWLPDGKSAAICFTIDDIHPGRSTDAYEAGGDLGRGALGHVEWLLARHPELRVTLFTTADWREISPRPTRTFFARVPLLRDRLFLTDILPEGTMRLDRHPAFVAYLKNLPRTEVGLHGLHHIHRGPTVLIEFQDESVAECQAILTRALRIFESAGLPKPAGMTPPGWNAPPALLDAMARVGFAYISSARDIRTPISPTAKTAMSGLLGVSLVYPELVGDGRLVHMTANFQATSEIDRALQIVGAGGLLSVKAHIIKTAMGHVQVDGLDALYRNYLDALFSALEDRFGERLWWTSMGEVASRVLSSAVPRSASAA